MVVVEYTETAEDHRSILLLVQQVGSHLNPKVFSKLYDRVAKIQVHRIPSQNRTVHLRYKKFYPPESSEWGEFQAHRRALGVIALGKCNSPSELPQLYKLYDGIKQQYGSTLFDSRLVVFGIDPKPGSQASTPEIARRGERTGTGNVHRGKGVYGKRPMDSGGGTPTSPQNTNAHSNIEDYVAEKTGDSSKSNQDTREKSVDSSVVKQDVDTSGVVKTVETKNVNPDDVKQEVVGTGGVVKTVVDCDRVSIGSSVEKDSGKGDSLDSRTSVLSHPLVGEEGDSTESDHSDQSADPKDYDQSSDPKEHDQSSDPKDHDQPKDLKDNENIEPADDINHNGVTEKEDVTESDLTKPRSSSTVSTDSGSSTASVVKDAPSHVIFYAQSDECTDLEARVGDFIDSLFWVLESKRLDRSQEKLDKLPMLATPFEKKDLVGVDTDGRVYRKRCQGRLKKQQGDLCLLAGLPGEALLHYQTAIDILKSANDWLWLGAAQEGLCSSYVIAAVPKLDSSAGLARNRSFSLKRGVAASKELAKMSTGTLRGVPNGFDLNDGRPRLPEDIGDKYKDAVSNYCKFKNAAVIEMEASIKACRVLATQKVMYSCIT